MKVRYPLSVLACIALTAGCSDDSSGTGESSVDVSQQSIAGSDNPPGPAYQESLHAESLHDGVDQSSAGTAYLEVGPDRYEFTNVSCTIDDTPGASRATVTASRDDNGHMLYVTREIGPDIGFDFENEHVQFAYLVSDGETERYANFMAQHKRDDGNDPEWLMGFGTSPLVRVVGLDLTATGEFEAAVTIAGAPSYDTAFTAAVSCPS